MSHNQSFTQTYVATTGKILAQGTTVDLAPNQVAIFDYPSYKATNAPTYPANADIMIQRGNNQVELTIHSQISNSNETTKEISGMKITGWRGKKAQKGRNAIYAIGYDGYDTDKTLKVKCGDTRHLYFSLSGAIINKLYDKQISVHFQSEAPGCSDCGDNCDDVSPAAMVDDFVRQINKDRITGKFLRAKKIIHCSPEPTDTSVAYTKWCLEVTDGGDGISASYIKNQYPTYDVKFVGAGAQPWISKYEVILIGTVSSVTAYNNAATTLIPNCTVCPTGYTSIAGGVAYQISIEDNGADKTSDVQGLPGAIAGSALKLNEQFGNGLYTVVIDNELTDNEKTTFKTANSGANSSAIFTILGTAESYCRLTTPGTVAWSQCGTYAKYPKAFTLTIAGECNTNRLAEVQKAYPDLTIAQDEPNPDETECVHRYTTTVNSSVVEAGCATDVPSWVAPAPFEGTNWVEVVDAENLGTDCSYGIQIEVAVVDRITNECTYDYWPAEFDTVHVQISEYDHDYNGNPNEERWPITQLKSMEYPIGTGAWVREQEKKSLQHQLRERSKNPLLRELEGYKFAADPTKMYDSYSLEYSYTYPSGGSSGTVTDRHTLHVYFPTGQGKEYEKAINGYVSASAIGLKPVIL